MVNKTLFLLDTNVLILAHNQQGQSDTEHSLNQWLVEPVFCSVITQIEFLGWHNISAEEKSLYEDFCSRIIFLPIDEQVVKTAILLRQNYRIKTPDALIAATAMRWEMPLVSANERDFRMIQGLNLISPLPSK